VVQKIFNREDARGAFGGSRLEEKEEDRREREQA